MLDFRKVLLAAAVASLGLVSSASAQVWQGGTPTAVPGVGYAFVEATTQLVPTISIPIAPPSAAGNGMPAAGTPITLLLNSNVAITNVLAAGSTTNLDIAVFTSTTANCAAAVDGANSVIATASPTQIQITFNSITVPSVFGTPAYICVSNLRLNASQVGATAAALTVAPGFAGGLFVPLATSANTLTVAFAYKSLGAVSIQPQGNAGAGAADANNINTSICNLFSSTTASATGTSGFAVATLTIPTNPSALLPAAGLSGVAAPVPTAPTPPSGVPSVPVAATQGVRLAITFTNLVANVNYYVAAPTTTVNMGANALSYYSAAAGGSALNVAGSPTTFPAADNVANFYLLTATSGTATIYLNVNSNAAPTSPNTITIQVYGNVPSNVAVQSFVTSPVAASVTLVGTATGYPQYAAAQTPYAATPAAGSVRGLITACSTSLLFPYVVNNSGFDTAMVITDASTTSTGTCTITFYGTGTATNPTVYAPTTVMNAAANTMSFTASGQAPGITGYAVAVCDFTAAHGYAFLFSGAGTPAAYAADYLAIVTVAAGAATAPTF